MSDDAIVRLAAAEQRLCSASGPRARRVGKERPIRLPYLDAHNEDIGLARSKLAGAFMPFQRHLGVAANLYPWCREWEPFGGVGLFYIARVRSWKINSLPLGMVNAQEHCAGRHLRSENKGE